MPFNKIPCIQLPHLLRQFQNKEINYINHYQKFTTTPDNNNQSEDDSTHSTEHVETVNQLPKNQSSQKQSQST